MGNGDSKMTQEKLRDIIKNLYVNGIEHMKEGNYEIAMKSFNKLLEIVPDFVPALHAKGSLFCLVEKYNEAGKCYDEILKLEPDNTEVLCDRGRLFLAMDKYEESKRYFERALKVEPANINALIGMANVFKYSGKYKEAMEYCDKLVAYYTEKGTEQGKSGIIKALQIKADCFEEGKKIEEAIKCYDKILEIEPDNITVLTNKGMALGAIYKFEEAIKTFDRVLKIDPQNETIKKLKIMALQATGKPAEYSNFGVSLDEKRLLIRKATGRFGYDKTSPIPVCMASGEREYLSGLLCPCGVMFNFERDGSLGKGPDGHIVDQYYLECKNKKHKMTLYMDMYHQEPTSLIPYGLSWKV